jgi:hypothetical protein
MARTVILAVVLGIAIPARCGPAAAPRDRDATSGPPSAVAGDGSARLPAEVRGPNDGELTFQTRSIPGRVVFLGEALERRYDIKTVPEARQRVLALETPDGRLLPLVEDLRGRSFRKDPRLRRMDVELEVRQYQQAPLLQILRIYERQETGKFLIDYWCDVCAIVMYQDGPCDCCQDHNRLRKRPVEDVPGL